MWDATRRTVATFGVIAGLAGIEHGIGEILQGNEAHDGVMILSWPESELFEVLAGEPAMTIVPSLLATGILAVVASLVFLVWAVMFAERKHGGLVLILLSVLMLLVGGGFGPPLLGTILGVAATRMSGAPAQGGAPSPTGQRHLLTKLWPWSFLAALAAWLLLMPGTVLFDLFFGISNPELIVPVATFSAFGLLLLTIFAGFARDVQRESSAQKTPSMIG